MFSTGVWALPAVSQAMVVSLWRRQLCERGGSARHPWAVRGGQTLVPWENLHGLPSQDCPSQGWLGEASKKAWKRFHCCPSTRTPHSGLPLAALASAFLEHLPFVWRPLLSMVALSRLVWAECLEFDGNICMLTKWSVEWCKTAQAGNQFWFPDDVTMGFLVEHELGV